MTLALELIRHRLQAAREAACMNTSHSCPECRGSGVDPEVRKLDPESREPCSRCKGSGQPREDDEPTDFGTLHVLGVEQEIHEKIGAACSVAIDEIRMAVETKDEEHMAAARKPLAGLEHILFDDEPHPDLAIVNALVELPAPPREDSEG